MAFVNTAFAGKQFAHFGHHVAGCHSTAIVQYPIYAAQVAEAIVRGEAARAILICSTGIGMSLIANRYRGIRALLCTCLDFWLRTPRHFARPHS